MLKKGLTVGVVVLFLGISVIPDVVSDATTNGIIYVDDDGAADYTKIQDAIDNASDGDTILVYNGTYNENIIVDKPLTIRSEYGYANCTIKAVDLADAILKIINHSVTIKGFNIGGRELAYVEEAIMLQHANNCNIIGNYLHDGNKCIKVVDSNNNYFYDNLIGRFWGLHYSGFWFSRADNNIVCNNIIRYSFVEGIKFSDSDNNQFNNNILDNCLFPFYGKSSENNYISNNIIKNSNHGINLYSSNNNTMENNNISVLERYGEGIVLKDSNYNIIKNHIFINNGISLENSFHNIIENISIGGKPLVYMEDESNKLISDSAGQIILINCDNVTVKNQNISDVNIGIALWNTSNSIISNNRVSTKRYDSPGIRIKNGKNNLIFDNYLTDNDPGLFISSSDRNQIYSNTFHDNDQGSNGGIKFGSSNYNNIFNNTITNNYKGIIFSNSCNNNIFSNQIIHNGEAIYLSSSSYNNITHNFFDGFYIGAILNNADRNNISYNNFVNGTKYGIKSDRAKENNITYNIFLNNKFGMYLQDSSSNRINYNNFLQSSAYFYNTYLPPGLFTFNQNDWDYNFWDILLTSPKIIWGVGFTITIYGLIPYNRYFIHIPWFDFDRYPAQEPYDIPVPEVMT